MRKYQSYFFCWNLENSCISRDALGVKNCKCLSLPKREGSPSPKRKRCMMKWSFLAKNCWIGFLKLYSVQKQIVGSNLGLPATQTHKRMQDFIPWTHTIKSSKHLCSYSVWKVQRKTNEQVQYYCILVFYKWMSLLCARCFHWMWETTIKQAPCTPIFNRLMEVLKFSFTNTFANVIIPLKNKDHEILAW